jgi:lipoate-protein ligase A
VLFPELSVLADTTPLDGFYNMALDEALLDSTERPVLRLYRWDGPWISFGYFGRNDSIAKLHPGRPRVRRWTGGGIVEHGNDLTYSLIVPASHPFALIPASTSYRMVHEAIGPAFGPRTQLAPAPKTPSAPDSHCFAAPASGDLLEGDAKIAGAAQRRTKAGLLHQGSIRPCPPELWNQLPTLLAHSIFPETPTPAQTNAARALAASRYGSPDWLGRR